MTMILLSRCFLIPRIYFKGQCVNIDGLKSIKTSTITKNSNMSFFLYYLYCFMYNFFKDRLLFLP